jgi:hypothetical protein
VLVVVVVVFELSPQEKKAMVKMNPVIMLFIRKWYLLRLALIMFWLP